MKWLSTADMGIDEVYPTVYFVQVVVWVTGDETYLNFSKIGDDFW